jgi:hypothetical protein
MVLRKFEAACTVRFMADVPTDFCWASAEPFWVDTGLDAARDFAIRFCSLAELSELLSRATAFFGDGDFFFDRGVSWGEKDGKDVRNFGDGVLAAAFPESCGARGRSEEGRLVFRKLSFRPSITRT